VRFSTLFKRVPVAEVVLLPLAQRNRL